MNRRLLVPVIAVAVLAVVGVWWWLGYRQEFYFTGFVEGEERVLASEVPGRVVAVEFGEGDPVPASAVVARLDDADIQARLTARRREIDVLAADIRTQEERIELVRTTWTSDVSARRAEVRQAEAAATLAERTLRREADLAKTGASTTQLLDEARAGRDQARSALDRARDLLARGEAQEREIAVARHGLETLRQRHELIRAQVAELEVTAAKYAIRAPAVPTTVQTQFVWPGELAQPGTPVLAVLDPRDKYVQIYVPVSEVARVAVGRRVAIELDSRPGERVPGEVTFVADSATFTPEKIETRSDRMGQVYRAKVRILEGVERLQPGTEGNVYLLDGVPEGEGMTGPLLHVRGLTKRYGRKLALAGVDLTIEAPEIVGIVGPDGAGKTTLLRALAGLLDVEAREATVLGVDLRGDVMALKERTGYVPQTFSLHRDLSVQENLEFTARLHSLSADVAGARVGELLERTGLAPFADRPAGKLSGGMRQKLAVANALLPHPALLVLDEPTAGVDVLARDEIWTMLTEVRRDTLVLLSTSYLDEAEKVDRLVYLDDGRVVANGPPAALRAAVPVQVYRVWGDDARAIARAARALPYVESARATGRYARVEVERATAPAPEEVRRRLAGLAGVPVRFAEATDVDMEAALVALARQDG